MKKYLAIILALCMVLSLCACGQTATPAAEETAAEETAAVEEPVVEEAPATEPAMTYADFAAAAIDDAVVVECYVQAHESWWSDKITVYAADKDGAYLLYDLACSEEDAAKLVPGAKIRVSGVKAEWSGEIEIADATFEFVDGDSYVAPAYDATELYGTDELADHMNALISVKGLVIAEDVDSAWDASSDLYIPVTLNGQEFTFTLRRYLTGNDSDTYAQVKDLVAGDIIDVEAYLYWYEGPQARIISAEKTGHEEAASAGYTMEETNAFDLAITWVLELNDDGTYTLSETSEYFEHPYGGTYTQEENSIVVSLGAMDEALCPDGVFEDGMSDWCFADGFDVTLVGSGFVPGTFSFEELIAAAEASEALHEFKYVETGAPTDSGELTWYLFFNDEASTFILAVDNPFMGALIYSGTIDSEEGPVKYCTVDSVCTAMRFPDYFDGDSVTFQIVDGETFELVAVG